MNSNSAPNTWDGFQWTTDQQDPKGWTQAFDSWDREAELEFVQALFSVNLDFRLEGNFWHLVRWEDVRGGTAPWNTNVILPTLGELRGAFRR
jgi:hypothetical protein